MFKTWPIGRVFGVDLKVHGTLFALLAVVALFSLFSGGIGGLLSTALIVVALVLSVTLHEFGHIAAASFFGNTTRGVTLTPIGGVAQLEHEAETATEEIVVALAGPAVSFLLAALAALPLILLGPSTVALVFLQVNLMLGVFNLLPAYPMDGGRVLRGVLWSWQGYFKATWNAARAGQAFALLLALAGLVWSGTLVFVALFVGLQATLELARLRALRAIAFQKHGQLSASALDEILRGGRARARARREQAPPAFNDAVRGPGRFTKVTWVQGADGRPVPVDRSGW
jgi:Zn-dependent protease